MLLSRLLLGYTITTNWTRVATPWIMITSLALEIVFFIIRGLYADQLYWKFIREKIDTVKNRIEVQESYIIHEELTKRTGVYFGGAILMSIGIGILDELFKSFILLPLTLLIADIL